MEFFVSVSLLKQLLRQLNHVIHMLGRPRICGRPFYIQLVKVLHERPVILIGEILERHTRPVCVLDGPVVQVCYVHDMGYGAFFGLKITPDQVGEKEPSALADPNHPAECGAT